MKKLPSVIIILLFTLSISCEKDKNGGENIALDEFFKSMKPISAEMPAEKEASVTKTKVDSTLEYITTTEYYEAAAGFNEQIVLNPQTDVIYPGALIKGESVLDGTYIPILAARKPITISTSLQGGEKTSIVVEDPKLSTVREAINTLMKQDYDVPTANMGFTIEQAYSEDQLALSLRASYKNGLSKVKGGFDFSNKNINSRIIAKFIQIYYTVDMDLPERPSDLFDENVGKTLFGTFMPMYVSTVTFGRMALFTIESELSEQEVRAYLDASYMGVNANTSAEFEALREKSTMKVYILGGSGSDAAATIDGYQDFKNYIKAGGNFSKASPGAPISYKLRYISDNSIGKIVFSASYPIVTRIPRTDNVVYDIQTTLRSLEVSILDAAGDCEIYGEIASWPNCIESSEAYKHFSRTESNYLRFLIGTFEFTEDSEYTHLWQGIKPDDAMMIWIQLREKDLVSNDNFKTGTFEVPVADIITKAEQGPEDDRPRYEEKFKVIDEELTEYYVDVAFCFEPQMRRIEQ